MDEVRFFIGKVHTLLMDEIALFPKKMTRFFNELRDLVDACQSQPEEIKYNALLVIEELLFELSLQKKHEPIRVKCNQIIELSIFIYFKACQFGIIHANRMYLLTQNACLVELQKAVNVIETVENLRHVVMQMSERLNLLVVPKIYLCAFNFDALWMLFDNPLSTVEQLKDGFMLIMNGIFYYTHMKDDSELRGILTNVIETILVQCFEKYDNPGPVKTMPISVTSQSIFRSSAACAEGQDSTLEFRVS